ncbi:MAG: hypothetical protein KF779_09000 [Hyphomonadaceae bacterium]|nr:hypothetical protein [Hyphomonadaceae bacterium]
MTMIVAPFATGPLSEVASFRYFQEYDCSQRRMRDLQSTITYRDPSRGMRTTGETNWQYAIPGTSGEGVLNFVCASAAQRLANAEYFSLDAAVTPQQQANALFYPPP